MATTKGLPDPEKNTEVLEDLLDERKEKILRCRFAQDRKLALAANLLLKYVLNSYGVSMMNLKYGDNGKPELDGICFNLSHSGEVAVCAVSDKPVGCDVEKINKMREKVASRFFTERENAYLHQFEGKEKDKEFFRLWTMKESYMKMTGEGMKLSMKRFEFDMEMSDVQVIRDGKICSCYVKEYMVPGYCVTVCGEEEYDEEIFVIECPKTPRKKS